MFERFNTALQIATSAHSGQIRKGTHNELGIPLPYITHPVTVATLVQRYGGTEDQVLGGLLHDVLEDGGPQWSEPIRQALGDEVLGIVRYCTDGEPDESGVKAPWESRKAAYIKHLQSTDGPGLLVSACDKLANMQSIMLDLEEHGDSVWDRFSATKKQSVWYYEALTDALMGRVPTPLESAVVKVFERIRANVESFNPLH